MTEEQVTRLLGMLKVDLGFTATAFDTRLKQYIETAYKNIKAEGAQSLNVENLEDAQLVVMYAAWMWRRRDSGDGMPRMVRYALNNRVLGEKARG